jgi:outer membrane protein
MTHKRTTLAALLGTSLLLCACGSLTPTPYTQDEIRNRIASDRQKMFAEQEPVAGPITFHEAAARALKYNLDYRLKLMESALARACTTCRASTCCRACCRQRRLRHRNNDSGGRSLKASTSTGIDGTVCLRRRPRRSVPVAWPT